MALLVDKQGKQNSSEKKIDYGENVQKKTLDSIKS